MPTSRGGRVGISLVEILISIAVVAILIGLTLPAIQRVRTAFRKIESANNLKQISLGVQLFHDNEKFLPPSCGWNNPGNQVKVGGVNGTAHFQILPYIGEKEIFEKFYGQLEGECRPGETHYSSPPEMNGVLAYRANRAKSVKELRNPKIFTTRLDPTLNFISPTSKINALSSYLGNKTLLDRRFTVSQIRDGTSNTLLFAEGFAYCYSTKPARWGTELDFNSENSWDIYDYMNNPDSTTGNYPNWWYASYSVGLVGPVDSTEFGRISCWAVGSEMIDFMFKDIKTRAKPVLIQQSDWKTGRLKTADMELQTLYQSRRADCETPLAPEWLDTNLFEDQANAKGLIPAFYKADGFAFQEERSALPDATSNPWKWQCDWFSPQALSGSLQVAMADGSVKRIAYPVAPEIYNAAVSPDGGELLPATLLD